MCSTCRWPEVRALLEELLRSGRFGFADLHDLRRIARTLDRQNHLTTSDGRLVARIQEMRGDDPHPALPPPRPAFDICRLLAVRARDFDEDDEISTPGLPQPQPRPPLCAACGEELPDPVEVENWKLRKELRRYLPQSPSALPALILTLLQTSKFCAECFGEIHLGNLPAPAELGSPIFGKRVALRKRKRNPPNPKASESNLDR